MRIKKFAGAILTIRLDTGKGEPVERVFGVDVETTGILAGNIANIAGDTPGALGTAISKALGAGRYSPPPELVEEPEAPAADPEGSDNEEDGA